jgi:hypothetical protein
MLTAVTAQAMIAGRIAARKVGPVTAAFIFFNISLLLSIARLLRQ